MINNIMMQIQLILVFNEFAYFAVNNYDYRVNICNIKLDGLTHMLGLLCVQIIYLFNMYSSIITSHSNHILHYMCTTILRNSFALALLVC